LKKRWPQRWQDFRNHYLVLTWEEKKVIAFIGAAFLLGLTTKCYRDQHPPPIPSVETKHSAHQSASSPRPKRSRAKASPTPNE